MKKFFMRARQTTEGWVGEVGEHEGWDYDVRPTVFVVRASFRGDSSDQVFKKCNSWIEDFRIKEV